VATVAGLTRIDVVGEMTSIGTLFAFVVVCAAVMMLRVKRPDARRPFNVPFGFVFPALGVVSVPLPHAESLCGHLGAVLRWLDLACSSTGSTAARTARSRPGRASARTPAQSFANLVTVSGSLGSSTGSS